MEISDNVLCLFTAEIAERNDSAVVRIPDHEIDVGAIDPDVTYRIAVLNHDVTSTPAQPSQPQQRGTDSSQEGARPEPPVAEGDRREVEIEGIGDQGDGIARVERGFVVIVPDTDQGERVTVEITEVTPTVAFGEVVERHHPKIE